MGSGFALRAQDKASDEPLLHHSTQVVEVDVGAALVPQRLVLLAGGGCSERSLRLRHSTAKEITHIVLVDRGFKTKLAGMVEERTRRTQLDSVHQEKPNSRIMYNEP